MKASGICNLLCLWLVLSANCAISQVKTLSGVLKGAAYRIEFPQQNWNRDLVLFLPGLTVAVPTEQQLKVSAFQDELVKQGYAVAQSGYSHAGWNTEGALEDVESLRSYFVKSVGRPTRTFLIGESLGGYYAALLLEQKGTAYAGGMAMCAPLSTVEDFASHRMIKVRVEFDFLFPGVLPRLDKEHPGGEDVDVQRLASQALASDENRAAELRGLIGSRNNRDAAMSVDVYTYLLGQIRANAHGNPFDNRSSIYTGGNHDIELNQEVARYRADPLAFARMRGHSRLSGLLRAPLLVLVPLYDPIVPASVEENYSLQSQEQGRGDFLLLRPVEERWHCKLTDGDVSKSFSDLIAWSTTRQRPVQ